MMMTPSQIPVPGGKHVRFLHLLCGLLGLGLLTTHGEVVIDGDFSDWGSIGQGSAGAVTLTLTDPADMGDSSGDLAEITATVEGENLILTMAAHGVILPAVEETPEGKTNRYHI